MKKPLVQILLSFFCACSLEARPILELRENFLGWGFGMFIHFNMATFNERDWANGHEDPATFAPDRLDCSQWADAAAAAGMKYAVLTVKHTGGWYLWDSKHTDSHDTTAYKNIRNGKGDIVREFVDAFRARARGSRPDCIIACPAITAENGATRGCWRGSRVLKECLRKQRTGTWNS